MEPGSKIPWVLTVVFLAAALITGRAYLSVRSDYDKQSAEYAQRDRDAESLRLQKDAEHKDNLTKLKGQYEKDIRNAGDLAVRNFCLRNPSLCRPAQCPGAGSQVDDGTSGERLPSGPDPEIAALLARAARDAAKIRAWIGYCTRNNCPVED